jgi:electron transfer flavoprotein beta subunit
MTVARDGLKVTILIKQVPIGDLSPEVAAQIGVPPKQDVSYWVNELDRQAIERVVQLKEAGQVAEATLISLGPERVQEALYEGLAMGADHGIHVVADDQGWSAQLASAVLAEVVRELEADLILCGQRTSDGGSACVGPAVAELLGIPQVTAACRLELSADLSRVIAHRRLERGRREIVECQVPALLTVADGLSKPRYVSLMALRRARDRELQRLTLEDLGCGPDGLGLNAPVVEQTAISPPRLRPRPVFVPGRDLPVYERIKLLLAGAPPRHGNWLEGDPDQVAEEIVSFLIASGIVVERNQVGRL